VSRLADTPANLLLVDDRRENLVALEAILEPLGQNLVTARSGVEALKHLLDTEFAVILLDVQMPEIDGFETARLIKQRERTRTVPIIFLTAISKEQTNVFRGYTAGAVDYLFKPFDPEILRSKVSVFIDLHRKTEELRRQSLALRDRDVAEFRRNLAESMPQIVWTTSADGLPEYFNQRWSDYTGIAPERVGDDTRVVHPDDRARTAERWRRSLATGDIYEIEHRLKRASDGSFRWHLSRALATRDDRGEIVGWVGTMTDIDDQKRAAEAQRFLVQASSVLGSSLDYRSTLGQVAQLAVPDVADWCAVDILEDGTRKQLAVAHADPKKVKFLDELNERYPPDPEAQQGPQKVVQTGEPELVPTITEEMIESSARDELHLGLLRELGLRSYMCVPMIARGRTLGAITFVSAESGRTYGEADMELAQELARRAATAVDNAQLYRHAEERAQAAQVLATIADGVCLVDGEGVLRLWNPAAEAITGLRAGDVVGRHAHDVLPGWTELSPRVPVANDPGTGSTQATTVPVQIGERELWLSFSGVGFEGGTVYAFRDLTEERALESMRQEFVATVSHELRTPLAAIYGSALTVRRADIELGDEMRDQLLGVIAEESDRLAQIVNDLLLASHLDSGRLHVATERCDGRALAEQVVEVARTHTAENIAVELDAPKRLPAVQADPGQLQQVLTNLVDNAIKYSPDGGTIHVRLQTNDRYLRFAIADEGLGIPASEHGRIFEKFYRLDPNMTRGIGGTGLGLYICRELVRRVNGRLWVESAEGKGSTFNVDIPLADAPSKTAASPAQRVA
jgi:PAS domain S-box-containing protein